ncbi:hypothetical protein HQ590_10100, partial [bacterium]|nr:hypothetical protein [bacterium]
GQKLDVDSSLLKHLLSRYRAEQRAPSCCEARDLILRARDLCSFDGRPFELSAAVLDEAWDSYFGGPSFPQVPAP